MFRRGGAGCRRVEGKRLELREHNEQRSSVDAPGLQELDETREELLVFGEHAGGGALDRRVLKRDGLGALGVGRRLDRGRFDDYFEVHNEDEEDIFVNGMRLAYANRVCTTPGVPVVVSGGVRENFSLTLRVVSEEC